MFSKPLSSVFCSSWHVFHYPKANLQVPTSSVMWVCLATKMLPARMLLPLSLATCLIFFSSV